ncbi:cytochrome c3 family protein [Puniceicoccaceae bacterium K14]|nr:cytochrome c3 family protein [Puniceicoccaceae bacterium K14]
MPWSKLQWIFSLMLPAAVVVYFVTDSSGGNSDAHFLPGDTSHGHHQIEMKCSVCHTDFEGVKQNACTQCHAEELEKANDSHPDTKFLDPRNADRLESINAVRCITCHQEHKPEETIKMGVTVPEDYCFYCHQDIAEVRPSHEGMGYETCATAGCHNYHDNSALYEDFIIKHLEDAPHKESPKVADRTFYHNWAAEHETTPLTSKDRDVPDGAHYTQSDVYDWERTAHAAMGINCAACHSESPETANNDNLDWQAIPDHTSCQDCHAYETKTFLQGKHGMRLAQDLSPMTPGMAKIPMNPAAAHRELSCVSCHGAHTFDTQFAAAESCMQCHDDQHTNSYKNSKHYQLWLDEVNGTAPAGSGVSCATCHMPRIEVQEFGETFTRVQHNQNETLRPNEKMIRPVCLDCHGLGFAIDALADPILIENNFSSPSSVHIDSVEMVGKRLLELGK